MNQYEAERLARIADNKKRMEELGLIEASKKLIQAFEKPKKPPVKRAAPKVVHSPIQVRRSSRVADLPAPNYTTNDKLYTLEYSRPMRRTGRRTNKFIGSGVEGWNTLKGMAGTEAEQAAIEAAEELIETLPNPAFLKVMSHSQVSGGFWSNAPRGLREHVSEVKCKISFQLAPGMEVPQSAIYVDDDEQWEVVWLPRGKDAGFSGGWRGFSIDLDLYPRDVVVFEVARPKLLTVHILRAMDFETEAARNRRMAASAAYTAAAHTSSEDEDENENEDDEEDEDVGVDGGSASEGLTPDTDPHNNGNGSLDSTVYDDDEDDDSDEGGKDGDDVDEDQEESADEDREVAGVRGRQVKPRGAAVVTKKPSGGKKAGRKRGNGDQSDDHRIAAAGGGRGGKKRKTTTAAAAAAATRQVTKAEGGAAAPAAAAKPTTTKTKKAPPQQRRWRQQAAVEDEDEDNEPSAVPVILPSEEEEEESGNGGDVEERYYVEKILDVTTEADGTKLYYIKWWGYHENESTWEPKEMLDADPKTYKRGPRVKAEDL